MATATLTLTEFLLARIAEDEERAAFAVGRGIIWARLADDVAEHDVYAGQHVNRWHPARVLVECEAKRRIVAEIAGPDPRPDDYVAPEWESIIRHLAAVYAKHPGYQEEWRP